MAKDNIQKVNFINDNFNSSEVVDLINAFINNGINSCNIKYMKEWEGNHDFDGSSINQKINQLKAQKKVLIEKVETGKLEGVDLNLNSILAFK